MSSRAATDRLRLTLAPVSVPVTGPLAARRRRVQSDFVPAAPSRLSSSPALSPIDARWVLASRAYELLEGGSAGVLRPESRARLIDLGRRLGLRPFDISLIIAIVQDHARCAGAEPRSEMLQRLSLVPGAQRDVERETPESGRAWWAAWIGAAAILATVFMLVGVTWLRG